jgi:hypothetical protein
LFGSERPDDGHIGFPSIREPSSKRDIGHVVRSLVYFAEADDDPPLKLLEPISWEQVKTDLKAAVAGLL